MTKPDKIFDSLLVLQCQSGNKKAMTLLVKRWHKKLCKQAYWYTQDVEISKDIAQDSWSKIITKIKHLKDPNSFGSWALTIVTRNAIDWQRKHKKEQLNLEVFHKNSSQPEENNNHEDLNLTDLKKSIKELPKKQQMVLHLFYVEEYSVKEISSILNVSSGTIKSRLFNAREKLKSILKNRNNEK